MPVVNIIDHRTNEFDPRCDAVMEIWTNTTIGGHGVEPKILDGGHIDTVWVEGSNIKRILEIGSFNQYNVTVFLYDIGKVRDEINVMPVIHPRIKPEPMKEIPREQQLSSKP